MKLAPHNTRAGKKAASFAKLAASRSGRAAGAPGEAAPSATAGAFQGADHTLDRGYVYFPDLDSRAEIDELSRTELLKRARFLYNNVGLVRRIINGISRMIVGSGLMPHPTTPDKAFNAAVVRAWKFKCESKTSFDLARKWNVSSSQGAMMRAALKDGDCACVAARLPAELGGRLRFAFYEGPQIATPWGSSRPGWEDGIQVDQFGGPVAYSFMNRSADGISRANSSVIVPAANVFHLANRERLGQLRAPTVLYHAVNKLLDRGEIQYALTKGIKLTSQPAHVIETVAGEAAPQGGKLTPRPQTIVSTPSGPIALEKLLGGGEAFPLGPGQQFKIITDGRPHPNVTGHLNDMVRDISYGAGFSPEVLWSIEALKGANTRFVMADTQAGIEAGQDILVDDYLCPLYILWLRDAIRAGDVPKPSGAVGEDWFVHGWLAPARLTVDFGRDGSVNLEHYKRGLITAKTLYGFSGVEAEAQIDQYLDERLYIKKGIEARGLTWAEAYPELQGLANPGAVPADPAEELDAEELDNADKAD